MINTNKILVFTNIPSPYQVELFNGITDKTDLDLTIAYLHSFSSARNWKNKLLAHDHIFLDDSLEAYNQLKNLTNSFDLIIFNYYQHPQVLKIMNERYKSKKPWCFWGEPLGYNQFKLLGKLYRCWKLAALRNSQAPIWGIGNWAIESYRKEFGETREYFNFPYFSDLDRFQSFNKKRRQPSSNFRFLFSGSLIHRKGVDLLSSAFARLAEEYNYIELSFLGDGDLRPVLEKQLSKYSQQVKFLGFQQWEDLPKFYQQADVFCFPSRYDGWGLVVPEALSSGLPVIGTDQTGSVLELIKNEYNGWLIKSESEESLYQAMKKAIQLSSEELNCYRNSAKESILSYSLTNGIDKFKNYATATINCF